MNIQGIDHFTIRTADLEASAVFYQRVLGLSDGPRPSFRFAGKWLYAGGRPVLHLVETAVDDAELEAYLGRRENRSGSGRVDHIALRGQNLMDMQMRLLSLGQDFHERVVPELGEHQLFIDDPDGIRIELIFPYAPDNRMAGGQLPRLDIQS
ncbi:Catechol 2,3-dioxygenase or related enzyme, vicinal oxygen chelate (VOC) family [Chromobacterium violaceum]|uniref:VOC family protein n=1 Tax=Chromobacterium violaceum TaxID=536 RepID=UPI003CF0785A